MTRRIVLAHIAFLLATSARIVAQTPALSEPPLRWVPFTAKMSEWYSTWRSGAEVGGGRYEVVELEGQFAQNELGATFEYWSHPLTPAAILSRISVLIDRVARARWEIDYSLKNVRRSVVEVKGHPEFSWAPMTGESFRQSHVHDESLGRKLVSGIACVEYRIRDSGMPLKMYREDVCFAPSLNVRVVRYHHMYPEGRDVTMKLEDVRIESPDPKMFLVPADFTGVH